MNSICENLKILKDPGSGDLNSNNRLRWTALADILRSICEAQGIDLDMKR